jgi:hypothetical protein
MVRIERAARTNNNYCEPVPVLLSLRKQVESGGQHFADEHFTTSQSSPKLGRLDAQYSSGHVPLKRFRCKNRVSDSWKG